jgi:RNA polymerase sigma factor (TIGR02999 family)
MASNHGNVTVLLHRWRDGSVDAEDELFRLVMPELQKLARYFITRERSNHALASSDLVDQIYFKLVADKDRDWNSRHHFFAVAGRAMRRYLIDYARKRGNPYFATLPELDVMFADRSSKMELALTVDKLLDELGKTEPELCSVVELKFFLGLTDEEGANALGLRLRTFQRIWQDARQWLFVRF